MTNAMMMSAVHRIIDGVDIGRKVKPDDGVED